MKSQYFEIDFFGQTVKSTSTNYSDVGMRSKCCCNTSQNLCDSVASFMHPDISSRLFQCMAIGKNLFLKCNQKIKETRKPSAAQYFCSISTLF